MAARLGSKESEQDPVDRAVAGVERAVDRLVGLLADEDRATRVRAAQRLYLLRALGIARMVAVLEMTRNTTLRLQVIQVLRVIGGGYEVVVPALYRALEAHEDGPHRRAFLAALSCAGPAALRPVSRER